MVNVTAKSRVLIWFTRWRYCIVPKGWTSPPA